MKKLVLLSLLLTVFVLLTKAQQVYQPPINYKFNNRTDYKSFENKVIETVDWLQDTPWDTQLQKQREATAFLFKWIQGTPAIVMELMPKLMDLTDRNNKLMATFMGGYAKYAIGHPGYTKEDANLAAVQALIAKYQLEVAHKKDTDIEHLIKLQKEGSLKDWVQNDYEKP